MAVTLAQIEQEVAPRCGPYFRYTASGGDLSQVVLPDEQSTLDLGGLTNLWVLRRGKKSDGSAVNPFTTDDCQRRVKLVTRSTGTLDVDRSYTNPPVANEVVELVYPNPSQELRPAVLRGLKRCYFVHRVTVALTGQAAERNLTASLAWLTHAWQLLDLRFAGPTIIDAPVAVPFVREVESAGTVLVQGWPDPFPQTLYVVALRPADTYVNGTDSTTGPVNDDDTLPIDLEYAARAGHAEMWRTARARMLQPAAAGLAVSQKEAADAFTEAAAWVAEEVSRRRVQYAEPYAPDLLATRSMLVGM